MYRIFGLIQKRNRGMVFADDVKDITGIVKKFKLRKKGEKYGEYLIFSL